MPLVRKHFDHEFYERFYRHPKTAVVESAQVFKLARFILAYLDFIEMEIETVLDAGCGVGHWRSALKRINTRIEYTGVEPSAYLCEQYGWEENTIAGIRGRKKYDLVICADVMQYLSTAELRDSVENLARLTRYALYVDVPTKEDFAEGTLDLKRTDKQIYLRSVKWYRRLLDAHFTSAGGGLFLPNKYRDALLAMERG